MSTEPEAIPIPLIDQSPYAPDIDPYVGMEVLYVGNGLGAEEDLDDPCPCIKGQRYKVTELNWSNFDELYFSVEPDCDPVWNAMQFIPLPTFH